MLTQILKVRRLPNQLVNLRFNTKRLPVAEIPSRQLLLDARQHLDRALVLHLARLLLLDMLHHAAARGGGGGARPVPRSRALGPPRLRDAVDRLVAARLHPRDAAVSPLGWVGRVRGRLAVVEAPGQKRVVDELNNINILR
jgi:hypothetical protein